MARMSGRMATVMDPERLLAAAKIARQEATREMAGVVIGSPSYRALERFTVAVDDLAEALTGDRERYWLKPGSIGRKG